MRKVLLIFSELTDGDVEWLSKAGERMHVDAGATLVPLGARVENIWFVLDGALSVHTAAGRQLALMGSGEVVGEMSLVDDAPRSADVMAQDGPVTVFALPREVFRKLVTDGTPAGAPLLGGIVVALVRHFEESVRKAATFRVLAGPF